MICAQDVVKSKYTSSGVSYRKFINFDDVINNFAATKSVLLFYYRISSYKLEQVNS
jgi:hypothetical protein